MECFITNDKIINFYRDNPNLNFEEINLIVVDFLQRLLSQTSSKPNENMLVDLLKSQTDDIQRLLINISEYKNDISKLELKINEVKTDYISNLKGVLSTSSLENNDKWRHLFEKETDNMVAKTKNIITDAIPISTDIIINKFKENINDLVKNQNQTEILINLNKNYEDLIIKIKELNTQTNTQGQQVSSLSEQFTSYTNKLRGSTIKGKVGEQKLEVLLNQLFPSDNIKNCTSVPHSGDFIVNRGDKINIMFETKDYTTNVPQDEVLKFIRDIEAIDCSGIFMSQRSGITSKQDYWVDIHKNNILVYMHNVDYDIDRIRNAITMIDIIHKNLPKDSDTNNDITINQLNEIYTEFQYFQADKDELIKSIQQSSKEQVNAIKRLQLSNLQVLFSKHFAQPDVSTYECNVCGKTFKSSKGLSNHQRACQPVIVSK